MRVISSACVKTRLRSNRSGCNKKAVNEFVTTSRLQIVSSKEVRVFASVVVIRL